MRRCQPIQSRQGPSVMWALKQTEPCPLLNTKTLCTRMPTNVSFCRGNATVLTTVYTTISESVLAFKITSRYVFISVKNKFKLSQIINRASKINKNRPHAFPYSHVFTVPYPYNSVKQPFITQDNSHPLLISLQLLIGWL